MEEGGGLETARSRRESDVSRGEIREHQEGEDAVSHCSRTEFQPRDISGREINSEKLSSCLRARGFIPHAYRRPDLSVRTDTRTRNRPDRLKNR